ncbi:MAG: hypothetical protein V4732_22990 [Pseudomonadota bacterium]
MAAVKQKNIPDELVKHSRYSKLVVDSQFEAFFDSVTDLTSRICEAPVSLITFVNEETVWVQSQVGFPFVQMLHNKGRFCGIFPREADYFEISDTDADKIHESHAFYIRGEKAKFYAGAKIKLPLGELIGVLSVFDVTPRTLNPTQHDYLLGMAHIIEKSLVTKNFINRVI